MKQSDVPAGGNSKYEAFSPPDTQTPGPHAEIQTLGMRTINRGLERSRSTSSLVAMTTQTQVEK